MRHLIPPLILLILPFSFLQAQSSTSYIDKSLVKEIQAYFSPKQPSEFYLIPANLSALGHDSLGWILLLNNAGRHYFKKRTCAALELHVNADDLIKEYDEWFKSLGIKEGFTQDKIFVLINPKKIIAGINDSIVFCEKHHSDGKIIRGELIKGQKVFSFEK